MTMDIKMLKAISDAAMEMALAVKAVVDDCAEQLAKRKAAGVSEKEVWEEPFAHIGKKADSVNKQHDANNQPDQSGHAANQNASSEPPITVVELRAFVAERSTPENRPIIKEILNQFGVKKLTELKEEQYRPLMEAVRKACP